jgi:hypothetical protein
MTGQFGIGYLLRPGLAITYAPRWLIKSCRKIRVGSSPSVSVLLRVRPSHAASSIPRNVLLPSSNFAFSY